MLPPCNSFRERTITTLDVWRGWIECVVTRWSVLICQGCEDTALDNMMWWITWLGLHNYYELHGWYTWYKHHTKYYLLAVWGHLANTFQQMSQTLRLKDFNGGILRGRKSEQNLIKIKLRDFSCNLFRNNKKKMYLWLLSGMFRQI